MVWQSQPIFISGTFLDMQAERDHLRRNIFPALEERLQKHRRHLEWVDLRVGVPTASLAEEGARELQVLKVCLAEVRRCRPFLIVLLGDRYGAVPSEERVRAAAREEGFETNIAGLSVTELEIDFGILANPEQPPRSLFYFREPLPYSEMGRETAALYSSAHDPDPSAAAAGRLKRLKERIEAALPARVRSYAAGWDASRQCVTGLEAFGQMVLDDIWAEFAAQMETAPIEDIPRQEAERNALEDFMEDRARDFVGRVGLLAKLRDLALSPSVEAESWGVCVTGEAGSGKSALFSEFYRGLRGSGTFILAHAAGASMRGASVEDMLRRWIEELSTALGRSSELPENASPETIEQTFAVLLRELAERRRVVVILDALDQFEATVQARFVSWLPRVWPPNACLIATAIPGEASKALAGRAGVQTLPLPPLNAEEAKEIAEGICKRYHRTLEPDVLGALLAHRSENGFAWENPLWMVLASELLNLIDADDLARAKAYPGHPAEQLRAFMNDIVSALPADIPGLYGATFDRAEAIYGTRPVQAFLGLIAISRSGWRDSDFRQLMPQLTGEPWDELQFARLRRFFRGQLRQKGLDCWDFNHQQTRQAVRRRPAAELIPEDRLNAHLANHLLRISVDDPLRESETMFHLIAAGDWTCAAQYYSDASLSLNAREAATETLASVVLTAKNQSSAVERIAKLIEVPGLGFESTSRLAKIFQSELMGALRYQAQLEPIALLASRIKDTFERLLAESETPVGQLTSFDGRVLRHLAASYNEIGQILDAQGKTSEALQSFRAGLSRMEDLSKVAPNFKLFSHDVFTSHINIGTALSKQGFRADALASFEKALAIAQSLGVKPRSLAEPNAEDWQRAAATAHSKIGQVFSVQHKFSDAAAHYRESLAIWERLASSNMADRQKLSETYTHFGDMLVVQKKLTEAAAMFENSHQICEAFAAAAPHSTDAKSGLALSHNKMGDALKKGGMLTEALEHYEKSLAIRKALAAADPLNPQWQRDCSFSHNKVGDVKLDRRERQAALASYKASLAIRERLAGIDPANADWQEELAHSYFRMAEVADSFDGALRDYSAALAIRKRLVASDGANSRWRQTLATTHQRIGSLYQSQGVLDKAADSFVACLHVLDKDDPNSQERLAALYFELGKLENARSSPAKAIDYFRQHVRAREHIAAASPHDPRQQLMLAAAMYKLAEEGDKPERWLARMIELLTPVQYQGKLADDRDMLLNIARQALSAIANNGHGGSFSPPG